MSSSLAERVGGLLPSITRLVAHVKASLLSRQTTREISVRKGGTTNPFGMMSFVLFG